MSKTSTDLVLGRFSRGGPTMGSRWSAVFFAAPDFDAGPLTAALQAAVDRVDDQMSTWKPTSDLERLNRAPLGVWTPLPQELTQVLEAALAIGAASGGAFDIGVGDLVAAWGFGGGTRAPDPRRIAALAGRATLAVPQTLELDVPGRRARRHAALRLDLGGIAKGFGVDELGRVMGEHGLSAWLVGIDGEMRGAGRKLDGTPWVVAQERPLEGRREPMGAFELTDLAVATSGAYRHVARLDGRVVSHTIDPASGAPLGPGLAAVSVLAETCMMADAWATVLMVLGETAGLALAERLGMSVVFVRVDGAVVSTL